MKSLERRVHMNPDGTVTLGYWDHYNLERSCTISIDEAYAIFMALKPKNMNEIDVVTKILNQERSIQAGVSVPDYVAPLALISCLTDEAKRDGVAMGLNAAAVYCDTKPCIDILHKTTKEAVTEICHVAAAGIRSMTVEEVMGE